MITTGEIELGYKNLKTPSAKVDEAEWAFGLMTKDRKDDWGKAVNAASKQGYNIINHQNYDYEDPENYLTYT